MANTSRLSLPMLNKHHGEAGRYEASKQLQTMYSFNYNEVSNYYYYYYYHARPCDIRDGYDPDNHTQSSILNHDPVDVLHPRRTRIRDHRSNFLPSFTNRSMMLLWGTIQDTQEVDESSISLGDKASCENCYGYLSLSMTMELKIDTTAWFIPELTKFKVLLEGDGKVNSMPKENRQILCLLDTQRCAICSSM